MSLDSLASHARCLVVWLATTGALLLCSRLLAPYLLHGWTALREPGPVHPPLDRDLTDLAALVLLGCACWLWVASTAVVVETVHGARLPVVAPVWVRRGVLAACGVALAGGLGDPAFAVTTRIHADDPGAARAGIVAVLDGLPLPDRAVGRGPGHPSHPSPPTPAAATRRRTGSGRTVVVETGDTLWSIAARHLAGASPAETDRLWRAIYAANHDVIGDDPDHIEPGQHLHLPGRPAS